MAQEEADAMLADARSQVDAMLADAKNQAEAMQEQARKEGFAAGQQEGNARAREKLDELAGELEREHQRMEEDYQQKIRELEPYLIDVVADVFEKVFHVQFDDKKEILLYLIQKVILNTEETKEFQIRVSLNAEEHKSEIQEKVGASVHIEIMADAALQERQCMIETDSGIFDCGMDIQLDNLIKALKSLSL